MSLGFLYVPECIKSSNPWIYMCIQLFRFTFFFSAVFFSSSQHISFALLLSNLVLRLFCFWWYDEWKYFIFQFALLLCRNVVFKIYFDPAVVYLKYSSRWKWFYIGKYIDLAVTVTYIYSLCVKMYGFRFR